MTTHHIRVDGRYLCGADKECVHPATPLSDALRLHRDGVLGREVTCVDCCAALRASAAEVGRDG